MALWGIPAVAGSRASDTPLSTANGELWWRLRLAIEDSNGAQAVIDARARSTRSADPEGEFREFEPFFRAHERDIFTYLWRMTGDEQAAYDLAQETFLRAWRHFPKIRVYERPGGWLFRVATNLALNHLRGRATLASDAVSLDAAFFPTSQNASLAGTASDPSVRVVTTDTVRRTLMALVARQRAALVLREVYGLPCAEVAVALGISVGAAKVLLWRAREEFRARYAEEVR